jgi:hypothetical protein
MDCTRHLQLLLLEVVLVSGTACTQGGERSDPHQDASSSTSTDSREPDASPPNTPSEPILDAGSSDPGSTSEPVDVVDGSDPDASNATAVLDGSADANDGTGITSMDASLDPPVLPPQTGEKAGSPVGGITISLEHGEPDYATLSGKVYAAPRPTFGDWDTTTSEGDCELRQPVRVECELDCEAPSRCAVGGECAVEPPTSNIGTVRVWGLDTEQEQPFLELTKLPSDTYVVSGDKLAFPPFSAGDAIIFEATGGEWPAFVTAVTAIEPLELDSDEHLPFEAESDLTLTWVAGATEANINIVVDISFHGGTKGVIACSTQDDGELTIGGDMVTQLIELGVAGFPHVEMERASRGFANVGETHVEFNIVSRRTVELAIPGVVSCTENEECPEDQVCLASMCQETEAP